MVANTSTSVPCGHQLLPNACTNPINKAAKKAPPMLPKPPVTTTTKVSTTMFMSICKLAGSRGNCSAPPSPASAQPSTIAPSISGFGFTPSADSMARSCVAARSCAPKRVRLSNKCRPNSTSGPSTMVTAWYCGKNSPPNSIAPLSPGKRGANTSSGPKPQRMASCNARLRPKVATNWYSSGAPYNRRIKKNSAIAPVNAAPIAPKSIAAAYNQALSLQAGNQSTSQCADNSAPSIKKLPCAKLTMRVTPKIRVSPAAIKNSVLA
jgi:hypothetical protein